MNSIRFNVLQKCVQQFVMPVRYIQNLQKQTAVDSFATKYCMNLVEKNDHENYLCTLLLQGPQRRKAFALRAFNVEVANCSLNKTQVDPNILRMRLQFWYDSIDNCFAEEKSYVEDQPVLRELRNALSTDKLTKLFLRRLVRARDRPPNQQFVTMKQMEDYAEHTHSSLFYLLAELTGVKDVNIDHALSHLGKAQGITTLLRSIPHTGRKDAINIPHETIIKHGVTQERIIRDKIGDKGVEECIYEVASVAHKHLEKARSFAKHVPDGVVKVFLPAIATDRYLDRLRKADFRLSDPSCMQRDNMLPMAIYWHSVRNKY